MYLVLFLDHAVITVGKPNFSYKKGRGSNKQEISELLKYVLIEAARTVMR